MDKIVNHIFSIVNESIDDIKKITVNSASATKHTRTLIKQRKKLSVLAADISKKMEDFQQSTKKPLKKIKRDQKAIQHELDKISKRHFFLIYKNKSK